VEAEQFFGDLSTEQVDEILSTVHSEMLQGYFAASKKAIADYIFKDPHSRERANVLLVPNPIPEWGSLPFVGIEGTVGGPPDEWRAGIDQNRESVVRTLTICNHSALRLLNLWYAKGYSDSLLVDVPQPAAPLVDIDQFFETQKSKRVEAVQKFRQEWFDDVCSIVKEENIHLGSMTEGRFFTSIATLLAVQTRSAVSQTVDAFVNFFGRFSKPQPLSPEEVTKLKDTDEREDSFLLIKLTPKGDEIRLKNSLETVSDKIDKTFREFIVCLNDIPLPETQLNRSNVLNMDKLLWGTSLEEQYVQQAGKMVDKIVNANMINAEKSLKLYDEFTHLLVEEEKVKEFVKDPSRQNADEYMQRFLNLKQTEQKIREQLPNEIRLQMATIDCVELNDALRTKAKECQRILLDNIVTVNYDRNDKLCKAFEQIVGSLAKKPSGAGELVDLEQTLEQFRSQTMKELFDEFADIRAWQQMLFDCEHELQTKDFKAITESAAWVHKIDSEMSKRENELRNERDAIENRFKVERQKFEEDLAGSVAVVNKFKDAGNLKQMEEYLERILALKENFERAKFEADKFREREVLLGWDASEFEKLQEGVEKLQPYDDLWELVYKFSNEEKKWMRGPLFSIEPEVVDTTANTMAKRAMKLQNTFDSMNLPTPSGVAKKIKKDLDGFKQHLPLVHALCNPGLRQRHWDEISEVVGFAMERDVAFTLSRVIDMDVGKHMKELQEISDSAGREYGLESTLEQIMVQWEPVIFETKPWKDTETYIVGAGTVDEMQSLMDDHIIKAQTMKGSPYAKPFLDKIVEVESWLLNTQEIMDVWMKVQSVWLYLEPIFGSDDIVKQMPTEANLFKQVDSVWRTTMTMAKDNGKALTVTKHEGLYKDLKECNDNLETVQKGLNDYLETKRLAFPRFFFLSNDNLLEILSETKDPTKVNPHMKKAFEGIQALEFEPGNRIVGMIPLKRRKYQLSQWWTHRRRKATSRGGWLKSRQQ
jgi:dynein heavy chain